MERRCRGRLALSDDGSLPSHALSGCSGGIADPEGRCERTGDPLRAVRRRGAAVVQTSPQRLRGEGAGAGLRLLHDLRAQPRPEVRRVHRQVRLRAHLSDPTGGEQTSAGSAVRTRHLCEQQQQQQQQDVSDRQTNTCAL